MTRTGKILGWLQFPIISDEHALLSAMYQTIYPNKMLRVEDLALSYTCYADVRVGVENFCSKLYLRSNNMSTVMAAWTEDDGRVLTTCPLPSDFRACRIRYFKNSGSD